MDDRIQHQLLQINQDFYDQFAGSFSDSRRQVQPGVRQLMTLIQHDHSIIDLGCGNGTLARALVSNDFTGKYLGIDMSAGLLANAERLLGSPDQGYYQFQQVDLAVPGWQAPFSEAPFDWLVSFAVLHHLPGESFRRETVRIFSELIKQDGKIAISVWQWKNSPRLRARVLPWTAVGLNEADVDEGDVLLDWRADETPGIRYVHTFTETSLSSLATGAGLQVVESYYSDGKRGDLALYQVWQKYS